MTPERWERVNSLFRRALEVGPEQRAAVIEEACAGDEEVRREAERLLAWHEQSGTFLAQPAAEAATEVFVPDRPPVVAGQRMGRYEIVGPLGAGGMGEVYRARDTRLGREVALKLLPAALWTDAERLWRFEQEARAASSLNHPNVLTVHDIGMHEGGPYLVTELLEGETLRERLRGAALPADAAGEYAAQIARGLAAAHERGIVHRDLKPENLFITSDGRVKILDFGLAKVTAPVGREADGADASTVMQETATGMVMGTFRYMSPEQARGLRVDQRSDVFTFGAVLYEMLTGRPPFERESAVETMHAIIHEEPALPAGWTAGLPADLIGLARRCLRKDPEQRFQSAGDLASAFDALAAPSIPPPPAAADRPGAPEAEAFVGREPELARLETALDHAADGRGRVVFVTGEPGMGKTSLVDEFLRRARAARRTCLFARGHCVEHYGTGEAYLPFLDALAGLLESSSKGPVTRALRTWAPTWCLQLPGAFASPELREELRRETIGATKERMLREMGDCLGALAADYPTVVVLEDLHWADPSSVDLLRHLVRRVGSRRLLLVCTFRPGDLAISDHPLKSFWHETSGGTLGAQIALGVLEREHLSRYLDARFRPNDFPPALIDLVLRKTGGHPLFATRLVQYLADQGEFARRGAGWSLARPVSQMDPGVPEDVLGMIRRRLEMLDAEDRRALQYASVEGEEFRSTVLAGLLGADRLDVEERLDRLGKVYRLVESLGEEELPDGSVTTRYRFAHALYQSVLYEEMVGERRRRLHARSAELLEASFGDETIRIAAQLAVHFERGRDFARAVGYLSHAGDNAVKVHATLEADRHFLHALDLAERLSAADRAPVTAELLRKRGAVATTMSRFGEAIEHFGRAIEAAREAGKPEAELAACSSLLHALVLAHRFAEVDDLIGEALALADRTGQQALRLEILTARVDRDMCMGNVARAGVLADEIILSAEKIGHAPALALALLERSELCFHQSEYERAEGLLARAMPLATELGDGFLVLYGLFLRALVAGNLGRMTEALLMLDEITALAGRNGDTFWLARVPNCLGWIHRELQNFAGAAEHDRRGVEVAERHNIEEAQANALVNLALDAIHCPTDAAPAETLGVARQIAERKGYMSWRYGIRVEAGAAEYWLERAELDKAEAHARRALEAASAYDTRKYIAVARWRLAEVAARRGDLGRARAELTAAVDVLREHPAPLIAWKIYSAFGRVCASGRDYDTAREAFAEAGHILDAIAANVGDSGLRSAFLDSEPVREVRRALVADFPSPAGA